MAIAEFTKLSDEIASRTSTQWTLLGLSATVSSTIGGFVLAEKASPLLLLVLPVLTSSLGLLFLDHAANIGNIAKYVNTVIKPLLREEARDPRLLSYGEWVESYEERTIRRLLPFGVPLLVLFSAVPITALLYTVPFIHNPWAWVLWAIGAIMTAIQVSFWMHFLLPPIRRAVTKRSA